LAGEVSEAVTQLNIERSAEEVMGRLTTSIMQISDVSVCVCETAAATVGSVTPKEIKTSVTAKEDEEPSSCSNDAPKAKIEGKDETTESKGTEDKLNLESKLSEGVIMNENASELVEGVIMDEAQDTTKQDDQREPSPTNNPPIGNVQSILSDIDKSFSNLAGEVSEVVTKLNIERSADEVMGRLTTSIMQIPYNPAPDVSVRVSETNDAGVSSSLTANEGVTTKRNQRRCCHKHKLRQQSSDSKFYEFAQSLGRGLRSIVSDCFPVSPPPLSEHDRLVPSNPLKRHACAICSVDKHVRTFLSIPPQPIKNKKLQKKRFMVYCEYCDLYAHDIVPHLSDGHIFQKEEFRGLTCFEILHEESCVGLFADGKKKGDAKMIRRTHPIVKELCESYGMNMTDDELTNNGKREFF